LPDGCDITAWRRLRDEWWLVRRVWLGRRSERERELANELLIAEQGHWYTALPRPLFALAFVIYVWKVVVFDKVFGFGSTDPLSGDVAQWAMIVLTAYFGGRSLEKVARVLARK